MYCLRAVDFQQRNMGSSKVVVVVFPSPNPRIGTVHMILSGLRDITPGRGLLSRRGAWILLRRWNRQH